MILILSIDGDTSTDNVIGWLNQLNYPFLRINAYDLVSDSVFFNLHARELVVGEKEISLDEINSIWFRKFRFYRESKHFSTIANYLGAETAHNIATEYTTIYQILLSLLSTKKWLTDPKASELNKINVLNLAASLGLNVPNTYIVSDKRKIQELSKEKLIVKSIYNPKPIHTEDGYYAMFTSRLKDEDINDLPNSFFPSLVQKEIVKQYEVRSFFLVDTFYSMAIFTQEQAQTEVDSRNYNWTKPYRSVPYKLPVEFESKIATLLSVLNINCASIDIIKGQDDNYYFLEINPNGQFGNLDLACNYGIHKKIAETLIEMDKK